MLKQWEVCRGHVAPLIKFEYFFHLGNRPSNMFFRNECPVPLKINLFLSYNTISVSKAFCRPEKIYFCIILVRQERVF